MTSSNAGIFWWLLKKPVSSVLNLLAAFKKASEQLVLNLLAAFKKASEQLVSFGGF